MPMTLIKGPLTVRGKTVVEGDFEKAVELFLELQAQTPGVVPSDRVVRDYEWYSKDSIYNLLARDRDTLMATRNINVIEDFATDLRFDNGISIEFFIFGGVDVQRGETRMLNNCVPRIYITRHGPDSRLARYFQKGDLVRGVGIMTRPDVLLDTYGMSVEKAPAQFKPLLTINQDATVILPLPSSIRDIVQSMIFSPYQGLRSEIFLRAKFDELMCGLVELLEDPRTVFLDGCNLPRHKREAMRRTIEILDRNFAQPPNLEYLSSQAGLSQRSLTRTFSDNFSMNISEYLKHTRMNTARHLLRKGKLSIMEVALETGYIDQSSFGRAYKRYFNRTPKNEQTAN